MVRARGILFCGGGTGGHVVPGLAVAAACRAGGLRDLRWIGDPERLEARLVPAAGITLLPHGLSRPRLRSPRWLLRALGIIWACMHEMQQQPPAVVVALGGYAALVPGLLAAVMRRPLVVLEQNARPGRTNCLLARFADRVVTQFPEARCSLPTHKVRQLGNPVRAFTPHERGTAATLTLLVMGGSLAAHSLNAALADAAPQLARMPDLHVIHLAGEVDRARMAAVYRAAGLSAEVYGYCDDMAEVYRRCDLALCRAGATTVAELCACGIGALYVPLPWAADDHQTANARAVARVGGAVLLPQALCTAAALVCVIGRLQRERALVRRLGQRARRLARDTAAADVAQLVGRCRRRG